MRSPGWSGSGGFTITSPARFSVLAGLPFAVNASFFQRGFTVTGNRTMGLSVAFSTVYAPFIVNACFAGSNFTSRSTPVSTGAGASFHVWTFLRQ